MSLRLKRSRGLITLTIAAFALFFAGDCRPTPPPPQVPVGSKCSSIVIECYDEFARGSIDLLCVRPISRWNRTTLTWRLAEPLSAPDRAARVDAVASAFDAWSAASSLIFTPAAEGVEADITLSFVEAEHGDPFDFDPDPESESGVLGHAYFPGTVRAGAVHLFTTKAETWSPPQDTSAIRLSAVALHEIGHALGLTHSEVENAVMAPVYRAEDTLTLSPGDVSAIRTLYGSRDGTVLPDPVLAPGTCDVDPGNLLDPDGDGDVDNPDSDDDKIPDTVEVFVFDTDPFEGDTDGDGRDDFQEIFEDGTPPGVAGEAGAVDTDQDGLNDLREGDLGTDPNNPDTDADGLTDGLEVFYYGTDPLRQDTDNDELLDGQDPCPTFPGDCTPIEIPEPRCLLEEQCLANAECDDGLACTDDLCDTDRCCTNTTINCPEGEVCDAGSGECRCATDAPCDDGLFCNGVETCVDGQCTEGVNPCSGAEICEEDNDACVSSGRGVAPISVCTDASCNDGLFCNGVETCVSGACTVTGNPCDPKCGFCDEVNDQCRGSCQEDGDCDDGLFCNGSESCEFPDAAGVRESGCCSRQEPPCIGGEACDETSDICLTICEIDGEENHCDDGRFCNGREFCALPPNGVVVEGGDGVCYSGVPPTCDDEVACTVDFCDSKDDACVFVPSNRFCDDGLFCNGFETCSPCEPSQPSGVQRGLDCANGCLPGQDPCGDRICDDVADECDCLTDAHCPADPSKCVNSFCDFGDPGDPFDSVCATSSVVGCCVTDAHCPADPAKCLDSFCDRRDPENLVDNICALRPVPGCCVTDADCPPDPAKCLDSFCDHRNPDDPLDNVCAVKLVESCCVSDANCPADPAKCVDSFCDRRDPANLVDNICALRVVSGCCVTDGDCPPDPVKCVDSYCDHGVSEDPLDNVCAVRGVEGCCVTDADCAADTKCVNRFCNHGDSENLLDNFCDATTIKGCCISDTDCQADTKCRDSFCNSAGPSLFDNFCDVTVIEGCCITDGDCPADTKCRDRFCNAAGPSLFDNFCDVAVVEECCITDGDCPADTKCVDHFCNSGDGGLFDNFCNSTSIVGCCITDVDCPEDAQCADHFCNAAGPGLFDNFCDTSAIEGCCITDEDCPTDDLLNCVDSFCDHADPGDPFDNACAEREIPDCCVSKADPRCDDEDPCTNDFCINRVCAHSPLECDDGLFCSGLETCEFGECLEGQYPCNPQCGICDEQNDRCNEVCDVSEECSDGLFCNGEEVCDGCCFFGEPPCGGKQVCDENNDICRTPCTNDAQCNDENRCTNDSCLGGLCVFTNNTAACSDGNACTIGDFCSGGACVSGAPLDCDDGLFCNGPEVCNAQLGCIAGPRPCDDALGVGCSDPDALQECNEDTNDCIPCIQKFRFTLGSDNLVGTSGDNTFNAPLVFDIGSRTNLTTLQNSDSANGGDGSDVLNAVLDAGAATVTLAPTLTSIEIWNITDFGSPSGGATTLSAVNSSGLAAINSVNSTNDAVTVTNVNTLVNLGVTNTASDLRVTLSAPATNGNNDTSTLTLQGAKAGCTVALTTPVNGIETFNISSGGAAANVLDALTQVTGTTLTTINVSGAQNLTIAGPLNTSLTRVNASAATGATNLNLTGNPQNVTYTGGSGNDAVNFAAGYTSADTINGGGGSDVLKMTSAAANVTVPQLNVTNIEALTINDALLNNVIATHFQGVSTINLLRGFGAARTLTVASVTTLRMGDESLSTNSTANATFALPGAGTADILILILDDHDTLALTFTGAEVVGLGSSHRRDGSAADGGANVIGGALGLTPTIGSGSILLGGAANLTITGAVRAGILSATSFTGNLVMSTGSTLAISITGGTGNDALVGSTAADSIAGGDGNDTLNGLAGSDSLTGGNGSDTYRFDNSAAIDIVNDWTNGSDFIAVSSLNTKFAGGQGLAAGGGPNGSLFPQGAGAMNFLNVTRNPAASVPVNGGHFIKLTQGVDFANTDQATFAAAIGGSFVFGLTENTSMVGSFYDTTNSRMVLIEVASGPARFEFDSTSIEAGDRISVIARIPMTATAYANFTNADILSSGF